MATGKLLVAVIPARKAAKGPRKKRKRLEPGSTPLQTWSVHETGSPQRSAESTTTAQAIPKGDARG